MTVKLNLKLHLRNTNKYEHEEKYNIERNGAVSYAGVLSELWVL